MYAAFVTINYTSQQQERDLKEIFDIIDIDLTDEAFPAITSSDSASLSQEDFLTQQTSIRQIHNTRIITIKQRDFLLHQLKRGY